MRRCQKVDNKKSTIRVRVTSACRECRAKKTKCEIARPCTRCRDHNWNCVSEVPTKRGPRKNSVSVRKKKEITEVISNVPALAPAPAPFPSRSHSSHSSSICHKNSSSSPSSVSSTSSSPLPFSNVPVWGSSPSSGSNSSLPSSPTEEHFFNVKSDFSFFLAPTALIQNEVPSEVFKYEEENMDKLFTTYIKYEDV